MRRTTTTSRRDHRSNDWPSRSRSLPSWRLPAGILLIGCTLAALIWANSPWAASYFSLWHTKLTVGFAGKQLSEELHFWINDGLMAVFFLLVGLEIKREALVGELASLRKAALPLVAALGGMLVPASFYFLFNRTGPGAAGWGVPMATDIAFALGVLALLGDRVPTSLKVFLAALAIADDIGAVMVIAFFYTAQISWISLAIAGAFFIALDRDESHRGPTSAHLCRPRSRFVAGVSAIGNSRDCRGRSARPDDSRAAADR